MRRMKRLLLQTAVVIFIVLTFLAFATRAHAETVIIETTVCPNGMAVCYERAEVVRQGDAFIVRSSTKGTRCEIYGHSWAWDNVYTNLWIPYAVPENRTQANMVCSVCRAVRPIKRIEHKREVTDVEEVWEDDGTPVNRPSNQNLHIQPL